MNEPALKISTPAGDVRGVALVLHGGQSVSHVPTRPWQLAVLRMRPFTSALRAAGAEQGLAVAVLRYRVRGWNGLEQSPVADARWAMAHLRALYPDVPVALVGHSMGGRTAIHAADEEGVRVVVALAPWIEAGDPVQPVAGRRVLIAHGDQDRMTDPRASAAYAAAARPVAEQLTYLSIRGGRHAMLRRPRLWHDLAAGFVVGALWEAIPAATGAAIGTGTAAGTNAVRDALAGAHSLVV